MGAVLPVAKTALDAGQLETARRLYRRLLDVDPQSFQARMGLGEVAHQRRDGAQAMRWFLAALAHAKTVTQRHDALLHHGRAALDAGQLEHAQSSFARLTDPQEEATNEYVAYGLNGVGLTLLLSGDLRNAVTLMEQAVERLPGDQNLRRNLSRALEMLAEQVAETSTASDPGSAAAGLAQTMPGPAPRSKRELQAAADRIERAVARFEEAAERLADAPTRTPSAPPAPTTRPVPTPPLVPTTPPAQALSPSPPAAATPSTPPAPTTSMAPTTPPVPTVPPPAQAPPPTPSFAGVTGFLVDEAGERFVQMGAYATAAKANALADRLGRVVEQPVRVVEKRGLHRVRIGPVRTREALLTLVDALRDAGFGEMRLAAHARADSTNKTQDLGSSGTRAAPRAALKAFVVNAGGEMLLQVGAFGTRAKAAARADELRGFVATPIRVAEGVLPSGKRVHRVRVGPLRSQADLDGIVEALAAAGHPVAVSAAPSFQTAKAPAATGNETPATPAEVAGVDAAGAAERSEPLRSALERPAQERMSPRENGAAEAVNEVVQAALAAAEVAIAESRSDRAGTPSATPEIEPPPFSAPALARGPRAFVITQDEGVFVQIGDYDARAKADELVERLRVLTAEPVQVVGEGGADAPRYRVRVGPVETDADYEALLGAVADLGFEVQ